MKNQTIGLLVCTLLIATAVPAVQSLNIREIPSTEPNFIPQLNERGDWNETQKLLASDGGEDELFGYSVSLDNDTLLIGASSDDDQGNNSGSIYVFTRNGTTWTQDVKLHASDGEAGDEFGYTVSLDGDTALIGAVGDDGNMGSVYVFSRAHGRWEQEKKLFASDGTALNHFGYSVSLDGDTALIGAPDADNQGSAYVFTRAGSFWGEQAKLLALDGTAKDCFGGSVSLDGDTALIGAYQDDDNGVESGSAYVFTRTEGTWPQQAKLLAAEGATMNYFGKAVCLTGNTAVIGAPGDDDNGVDSGSAYVFTRTDTNWTQKQKLIVSDSSGFFGSSISQDGDYAIIGAPQSESTYVFLHTGTTWSQQTKLNASDGGGSFNHFGQSVSVSGEIAVIGAPWDDDIGTRCGSVYMFKSQYATYNLEFEINGGLGVKLKIKNSGTVNAIGVYWQIHVEGGRLGRINKTAEGTIDILVDQTKTVRSRIFFGFGPISIFAKVIHEEKTADGKQFIVFSTVK